MEETKTVKRKDLHSLKSSIAAAFGYIQLAQKQADKLDQDEAQKVQEMLTKAMQALESLDDQVRKLEGINEPLMDI